MYLPSTKNIHLHNSLKEFENRQVFQPELSTYIFYRFNELFEIDRNIANKFLKKEAFIKALNSLDKNYLNIYNVFGEDSLINYIIHRTSKCYYFFKKIGYYYKKNFDSITNNLFSKTELRIKCFLFYLKIVYEYSRNTKYEKDMSNILLTRFIKELGFQKIRNEGTREYFYDLIKRYLNSKFINKENKYALENYKKILMKL